jgi:hypothetical protein
LKISSIIPIEKTVSFTECVRYNISHHQGRRSEADVPPCNRSGIL